MWRTFSFLFDYGWLEQHSAAVTERTRHFTDFYFPALLREMGLSGRLRSLSITFIMLLGILGLRAFHYGGSRVQRSSIGTRARG